MFTQLWRAEVYDVPSFLDGSLSIPLPHSSDLLEFLIFSVAANLRATTLSAPLARLRIERLVVV